MVVAHFNKWAHANGHGERQVKAFRSKWDAIVQTPKPTGKAEVPWFVEESWDINDLIEQRTHSLISDLHHYRLQNETLQERYLKRSAVVTTLKMNSVDVMNTKHFLNRSQRQQVNLTTLSTHVSLEHRLLDASQLQNPGPRHLMPLNPLQLLVPPTSQADPLIMVAQSLIGLLLRPWPHLLVKRPVRRMCLCDPTSTCRVCQSPHIRHGTMLVLRTLGR
ncbi:hypothetical protein C8Q72DRAFT_954021 [Fomitopsis betulina]|nr:hypothetical protein C8Q72DRAFT_954021 [Fomitopsis betulina]